MMKFAVAGLVVVAMALAAAAQQSAYPPGQGQQAPAQPSYTAGQGQQAPGAAKLYGGAGTAGPVQPSYTAGQGQQSQAQDKEGAKKFIQDAVQESNFEIQLGEYVAGKAQDPQVQQMARQLVQDHQQIKQQAQQAAQSLGADTSKELNDWQRAVLDEVKQRQGQDLEREFLFMQVGLHQMDLLKNQYQSTQGQNPQAQQLARQAIPILQRHLQQGEQLARQFAGVSSQGQVYGIGQASDESKMQQKQQSSQVEKEPYSQDAQQRSQDAQDQQPGKQE